MCFDEEGRCIEPLKGSTSARCPAHLSRWAVWQTLNGTSKPWSKVARD
jgi:hypothetical protein